MEIDSRGTRAGPKKGLGISSCRVHGVADLLNAVGAVGYGRGESTQIRWSEIHGTGRSAVPKEGVILQFRCEAIFPENDKKGSMLLGRRY